MRRFCPTTLLLDAAKQLEAVVLQSTWAAEAAYFTEYLNVDKLTAAERTQALTEAIWCIDTLVDGMPEPEDITPLAEALAELAFVLEHLPDQTLLTDDEAKEAIKAWENKPR